MENSREFTDDNGVAAPTPERPNWYGNKSPQGVPTPPVISIESSTNSTSKKTSRGACESKSLKSMLSAKATTSDRTSQQRIVVDIEDESEIEWQNEARRWGPAVSISLIVHMLILGIFALVILSDLDENLPIIMTMFNSDDETVAFDEILELEMDISDEDVDDNQQLAEQLLDKSTELQPQDLPSDTFGMVGANSGEQDSSNLGFKFAMPKNGRVIKQGSFTVWTNPEDPLPKQDYLIVIQIKLPKGVRRYHGRDLSGTVVGTDGYRVTIQERVPQKYLLVRNNQSQVSILIPGGASLVKDTIQIRSRRLKENQKLLIEF